MIIKKSFLASLREKIKRKLKGESDVTSSNEEFRPIDVYCDNETLMNYIIDAKPSESGLYLHEIIMISYSSFSSSKTVDTQFPSIFRYQLCVEEPNSLLESLMERGYIKFVQKMNSWTFKNKRVKKTYMRFKELNAKGSSSTENTKKAIRENCSISEIVSFYKFLYYIPTEKGNNVIKNNEDFIKNRYAGWRLSSGYAKYRYVNPDCIEFYRKKIL